MAGDRFLVIGGNFVVVFEEEPKQFLALRVRYGFKALAGGGQGRPKGVPHLPLYTLIHANLARCIYTQTGRGGAGIPKTPLLAVGHVQMQLRLAPAFPYRMCDVANPPAYS